MHRLNQEQDIANHALELISITSTWLLVRHQWLINTMRCVLTGERPSPLSELESFNQLIPVHLTLSENLSKNFSEVTTLLENQWSRTTKTIHPMSGLTIFEQLNNYQTSAHNFMLASKEANQKLLHEFAMRDALTGTWTRLTLNTNLSYALQHAMQYNEPCSIALLDQNKFKHINDNWGHVIGDHVLVKTAEIIQNSLKPNDKLYRFGGDEWLIIMPNTPKSLAEKRLASIKAAYDSHEFKSNNDESFFSSFSYGIAESEKIKTPKEWVIAADKKLYAEKGTTYT